MKIATVYGSSRKETFIAHNFMKYLLLEEQCENVKIMRIHFGERLNEGKNEMKLLSFELLIIYNLKQ